MLRCNPPSRELLRQCCLLPSAAQTQAPTAAAGRPAHMSGCSSCDVSLYMPQRRLRIPIVSAAAAAANPGLNH